MYNTYIKYTDITISYRKEGALMELRVLNYFVTVAREKNISRAANVLHLSQPTLSKQLKELEEELNTTLFIRGNREITLTEEGEYLRQRGEEILAMVFSTTSNIMSDEVIGGQLSIGSGETKGFSLIADVLNDLYQSHPTIHVDLYSGNADDITRRIDEGLLDFGIVIDPVQKNKYDFFRLPFEETWGVLLNRQHSLANKPYISPEDLVQIPLFVSNQRLVDNQILEWLGKNKSLSIIGSYNLLFNASLLCEQPNLGVLCIDGIINTQESNLIFVPLKPTLHASINLIWKKDCILSNTSKLFLNKLRDNMKISHA